MGLLDTMNGVGLLNGLPAAWQYQTPQDALDKKQFDQELMQNPMEGVGSVPAPSPFGPIPRITPPQPPSVFDTGTSGVMGGAGTATASLMPRTAPFSFGGPQQPDPSQPQQSAQPQQPAPPQPIAAPTLKPYPALPSGAPPDYGQSRNVPIGHYQMPMFGEPASAVPSGNVLTQSGQPQSLPPNASPGFADRAMAGLSGLVTNAHTGPVGALLGGLSGLVTGQRSDPAYQQQQKDNLTAQALLAKGVSPQDVQAALVQPKLMEALINQHFAKQPPGAVTPRWDGRGRILR
jgi:hypothetical protein